MSNIFSSIKGYGSNSKGEQVFLEDDSGKRHFFIPGLDLSEGREFATDDVFDEAMKLLLVLEQWGKINSICNSIFK